MVHGGTYALKTVVVLVRANKLSNINRNKLFADQLNFFNDIYSRFQLYIGLYMYKSP